MPIEMLDPTWSEDRRAFTSAERATDVAGLKIGIVSNGKQGTAPFFSSLADELVNVYGVARVDVVRKANYSAPADQPVWDRASKWNALISGIGD